MTYQPGGKPKSVSGSTGFTPICPDAVGTIPLLRSPEETAGCTRAKRAIIEVKKKGCMVLCQGKRIYANSRGRTVTNEDNQLYRFSAVDRDLINCVAGEIECKG